MLKFLCILFSIALINQASGSSQIVFENSIAFSSPGSHQLKNEIRTGLLAGDTNTNDKFISIGISASIYKFPNTYFATINYMAPIGQEIYILTGLEYHDYIAHDNVESQAQLIYADLYIAHRWSTKIHSNIFLGGGFSIAPLGSILARILFRYDFALSEWLFLGADVRQSINITKQSSKYHNYPSLGFNFTLKL